MQLVDLPVFDALGAKAFQKVKVGKGHFLWLLPEGSAYSKPSSKLTYAFDVCRYRTKGRKRTTLDLARGIAPSASPDPGRRSANSAVARAVVAAWPQVKALVSRQPSARRAGPDIEAQPLLTTAAMKLPCRVGDRALSALCFVFL